MREVCCRVTHHVLRITYPPVPVRGFKSLSLRSLSVLCVSAVIRTSPEAPELRGAAARWGFAAGAGDEDRTRAEPPDRFARGCQRAPQTAQPALATGGEHNRRADDEHVKGAQPENDHQANC